MSRVEPGYEGASRLSVLIRAVATCGIAANITLEPKEVIFPLQSTS